MNRFILLMAAMFLFLDSTAQNLDRYADSIRIKNQIPELAYATVTLSGISSGVIGFHRNDLQNKETKAKSSDYFHLGSNTKAITAFIAAKLVQDKKIQWKTKVFSLFPEWKKESKPVYYTITLEDLLSHRAKVRPFTDGSEFKQLPKFTGNKAEQRKQFSRNLLHLAPVSLAGKTYSYSNAGYSLAAVMLEKASGKTWEQLVEQTLSGQLNLNYKFGWPNKYGPDQPWGHWIEKNTLKALPPSLDYDLALAEPAGDISMPIADYARFIQYNLEGLNGKSNLLKAEAYRFLHYGKNEYAMGWANANLKGKHLSQHAGSAGTFYCYTLVDKDKKAAYIVMANTATPEAQNGLFELLGTMRKKQEQSSR
ncbi:serine hydrolase domain-containing protein [Pedobacter nutrimenti]|uniref:CubicO group peptidase (Beta-lactamase class C family) n=1 Tax=Pedobacter nutrimenti TaxID=1241337 RepID=A0A318UEC0_9SPHI|nr:serine hydrolase domain-containing protein [Pedobacter nutrimenti]PYF74423.1 CubicO group peptidase (beta-lactamase class C family) [Pedobacter nutrimenti]